MNKQTDNQVNINNARFIINLFKEQPKSFTEFELMEAIGWMLDTIENQQAEIERLNSAIEGIDSSLTRLYTIQSTGSDGGSMTKSQDKQFYGIDDTENIQNCIRLVDRKSADHLERIWMAKEAQAELDDIIQQNKILLEHLKKMVECAPNGNDVYTAYLEAEAYLQEIGELEE